MTRVILPRTEAIFFLVFGVVFTGGGLSIFLFADGGGDELVKNVASLVACSTGLVLLVKSIFSFRNTRGMYIGGVLVKGLQNPLESPYFPKLKVVRSRRGYFELPLEQSRAGKVIGLFIGGLIFAGAPIAMFIGSGSAGSPTGVFLGLFLGIFVLVGLLLLFGAFHELLKIILVGRTHVEISREPVSPGDSIVVNLHQRGQFPITTARITLVGEEVAQWTETRGSGKNRSSHTVSRNHRFLEIVIVEGTGLRASNSAPILSGNTVIPENAMHSFSSFHCTIKWGIEVFLDIPRRPDVKEFHPLRVLPAPSSRRMSN